MLSDVLKTGRIVVLRTRRAVYTTCRIDEISSASLYVSYVVADALQLLKGRLVLTSRCDLVEFRNIVSISER
ncbi:hypothetical protein LCGC14_2714790 [marine sediment metagenome]|uniref:Uncharacterized protein n=1 Tax=marine sediment metagenome TaxID=412755 RepID=A0A0F8ZBV6_9ZZZZ